MKQNPRTGNWEHNKPKEETGAPSPVPPATQVKNQPIVKTKSKAKPKAKPGRG